MAKEEKKGESWVVPLGSHEVKKEEMEQRIETLLPCGGGGGGGGGYLKNKKKITQS